MNATDWEMFGTCKWMSITWCVQNTCRTKRMKNKNHLPIFVSLKRMKIERRRCRKKNKLAIHMLMLWWFNRYIATSALFSYSHLLRLWKPSAHEVKKKKNRSPFFHYWLPFYGCAKIFILNGRKKKTHSSLIFNRFVVVFPFLRNKTIKPTLGWHGFWRRPCAHE